MYAEISLRAEIIALQIHCNGQRHRYSSFLYDLLRILFTPPPNKLLVVQAKLHVLYLLRSTQDASKWQVTGSRIERRNSSSLNCRAFHLILA